MALDKNTRGNTVCVFKGTKGSELDVLKTSIHQYCVHHQARYLSLSLRTTMMAPHSTQPHTRLPFDDAASFASSWAQKASNASSSGSRSSTAFTRGSSPGGALSLATFAPGSVFGFSGAVSRCHYSQRTVSGSASEPSLCGACSLILWAPRMGGRPLESSRPPMLPPPERRLAQPKKSKQGDSFQDKTRRFQQRGWKAALWALCLRSRLWSYLLSL